MWMRAGVAGLCHPDVRAACSLTEPRLSWLAQNAHMLQCGPKGFINLRFINLACKSCLNPPMYLHQNAVSAKVCCSHLIAAASILYHQGNTYRKFCNVLGAELGGRALLATGPTL